MENSNKAFNNATKKRGTTVTKREGYAMGIGVVGGSLLTIAAIKGKKMYDDWSAKRKAEKAAKAESSEK